MPYPDLEMMDKFELPGKIKLRSVFDEDLIEIYYGNKQNHLKAIATKSKIDLSDMIFFDNQIDNCRKFWISSRTINLIVKS